MPPYHATRLCKLPSANQPIHPQLSSLGRLLLHLAPRQLLSAIFASQDDVMVRVPGAWNILPCSLTPFASPTIQMPILLRFKRLTNPRRLSNGTKRSVVLNGEYSWGTMLGSLSDEFLIAVNGLYKILLRRLGGRNTDLHATR